MNHPSHFEQGGPDQELSFAAKVGIACTFIGALCALALLIIAPIAC